MLLKFTVMPAYVAGVFSVLYQTCKLKSPRCSDKNIEKCLISDKYSNYCNEYSSLIFPNPRKRSTFLKNLHFSKKK